MQIETIKSFILAILVGMSLLLTFTLWTYQPGFEKANQETYADPIDLGGIEETMKSLIEPQSMIFQVGDHYYGFSEPSDMNKLYQNMQSWVLYEFKTINNNNSPNAANQLEIKFPDQLPMSILKNIFKFNDDAYLPDWNFKQVYITFNQKRSSLKVTFLSSDKNKKATAVVNNVSKFNQLWSRLRNLEGLTEYIRLENTAATVYIPKFSKDLSRRSVSVTTISPSLMVEALFNPNIVSRNQVNSNETYYTDSQRGILRVYQDQRLMVYRNPVQSTAERMEPEDVFDRSQANINSHKGWTDEYNLESLNSSIARYRMYYDSYPVYSNYQSSTITQQWVGQELRRYNRPLYSLSNLLGGEVVQLPSGSELSRLLVNSDRYDIQKISDIRLGYHLSYQSSNDVITLNPAWFMNYNNEWQEINFEQLAQQKGGD